MIKLSIAQPFEELQGWNLGLKLITLVSITGSHFGTKAAIFDLLKVHISAIWIATGSNLVLKLYTSTSIISILLDAAT